MGWLRYWWNLIKQKKYIYQNLKTLNTQKLKKIKIKIVLTSCGSGCGSDGGGT